ncbi:MAG TPA: HD domain-containing phosphohydrolase [Tepidisphaeraceae bacterium]|jgi:putative nucleotidyltransferase with HDIG domain|nr:HD domain-containing phosphohydrolase [Tepidisphaeraceae bacterium]
MNVQKENITTAPGEKPFAVPVPLLDGLASRFRAGGLFLLALRNDGSLAWHDPAAGMFFLRYVAPLLQYPELHPGVDARGKLTRPGTAVTLHRLLPGIILAAIPHVEKRQNLGTLVLAAREETFDLNEDVQRVCSRLGIDASWLGQQARELPPCNDTAMQRQARLVLACLRDQLRLAALEQELTSISEQLASTYEELSLIYQVSSGMKINRSAADFFKQTCLDVLQVMGMRGVGVALHGESDRQTDPVLYGQLSLPPDTVNRLGHELFAYLQHRKAPLLINDVGADRNFSWLREHSRQLLAVPLQRYEKTLGVLFALDKEVGEFDSADAKLLNSIANESAIYLENATLFDDVHGLMMGLMHSLTSAVDAKDAYTCGHSERVALLSRNLAQKIGLSDHDVEQVYMAGLLHDVGKIGVPESVLQKTGKLTTEEFEQMKKHPQIGARILQDVRQIKQIIPGVMHHHERFDGKGYPHGLAGRDIPLMGRIICLADSFDAMTSNRTYRKALPLEVALAEIRRCSGTHFDPELAEAFLETTAEGYRELLNDHQKKSKLLLDVQEEGHAAA